MEFKGKISAMFRDMVTGKWNLTFSTNQNIAEAAQTFSGKDIDVKLNPFMTQTALNNILTAFKDFSYMPGALKMMGDPRLDPWDVLTVEDLSGNTYNVPVMKLEWEYDGGLTYSVEAVGLSEEETNADYKGPQTKEIAYDDEYLNDIEKLIEEREEI